MPTIYERLGEEAQAYHELYQLYGQAHNTGRDDYERHECELPQPPHKIEGGELATRIGGEVVAHTLISIPKTGPNIIDFEAATLGGRSLLFQVIYAHTNPVEAQVHTTYWKYVDGKDEHQEGKYELERSQRPLTLEEKQSLLFDLHVARTDLAENVKVQELKLNTSHGSSDETELATGGAKDAVESRDDSQLSSETLARLKEFKEQITRREGLILIFNKPADEALKGIVLMVTSDKIHWAFMEKDAFLPPSGISFYIVDDVSQAIEEQGFVYGGENHAVALLDEWEKESGAKVKVVSTGSDTNYGLQSKTRSL